MKNKKLFGKLNIIDILILLILIAALVFAAVRLVGGKGASDAALSAEEASEAVKNLRFTVLCQEIPLELAEHAVSALNGEDILIGEDTVSPRRIFNSNVLYDAMIVDSEIIEKEDGLADLLLTIDAAATVKKGAFSIGLQEIRIGVSYIAKTTCLELVGQVQSLEFLS